MNRASAGREEPAARLPRAGIGVSALCLAAMIAIAWALWDALPDPVITRAATEGRPAVGVPRLVFAGTMPAVLVALAAIVAASTIAAGPLRRHVLVRLRGHLDPRFVPAPGAERKMLNVLFTVLPPALVTLQAGALARTAGYDFPLDRAAGVAFGGVLIGAGAVLPRIGPAGFGGGSTARFLRAWQAAQRPGGLALMGLGAACAAGVFLLPPMPTVVGAALLIPVVYALMGLLTVRRPR